MTTPVDSSTTTNKVESSTGGVISSTGDNNNNNNNSSSSSSSSSNNNNNNNKYDRQLRIWGSNGQYYVSNTCLIAVHVTAVTTETIKNCILPGIQHIHIIDINNNNNKNDTTTTMYTTTTTKVGKEYASNFFLTHPETHAHDNNNNNTLSSTSTTGTATISNDNNNNTRAAMALQYLLELNPDVSGSHETYDSCCITTAFGTTTNNINDYNNIFQLKLLQLQSLYKNIIVLGCDLDRITIQNITNSISTLSKSSSINNNNVPFLTVNSYGLIGILQIQHLIMHPIMNPNGGGGSTSGGNPTNATTSRTNVPDLRLCHPFPLLENYMKSFIDTHFITNTNTNTVSSLSSPLVLLSTHEYSNIPYPIILYYVYHYIWKQQYPNILRPTTMDQKKEFQFMIQNHYYSMTTTTTTPATIIDNTNITANTTINRNDLPINVQEAIQNSYLAYTEPQIDLNHIQSILQRLNLYYQDQSQKQRIRHPNIDECMKFFLVIRAIHQFMTTTTTTTTTITNTSLLPQQSSSVPPLHGTIPDMTASTNAYIELQSIYKEQSQIDITRLRTYLSSPQTPIGSNENEEDEEEMELSSKDMNTLIDDEYIRTFCFNIHNIDVISCRRNPISDPEVMSNNKDDTDMKHEENSSDIYQEISMILDDYVDNDVNDDVQIPFLWYICYEACQLFNQNEHRYPGVYPFPDGNNNYDNERFMGVNKETEFLCRDATQLQSYIIQTLEQDPKYTGLMTHPIIQRTLLQPHTDIMNDNNSNIETSTPMTVDEHNNNDNGSIHRPSKYAVEMVRYGNGEIHTIASIMGGIAAQEMIKIITYQYIPMNNTYVYNGITSTGAVYNV